jgi:hypothetical protein
MNTIVSVEEGATMQTVGLPISIESAPVKIELRMTPEEIREFVAKARAKDAEARERALAEKEKKD